MPRHRKEVHFFDQHYGNGIEWYSSFFEDGTGPAGRVGESTPNYLYHPETPTRIAGLLPDCQLIAMLRNPIDRAFSQYGHNVKSKGWTLSFEEAIAIEPQLLERGKYMRQLQRFLECFQRDRLLVLIFEEATGDPGAAALDLGRFLDVDAERFTRTLSRTNSSYVPRFARSYAAARSVGRVLRRTGFDSVVEIAKRSGVPRVFGSRGELAPMGDVTRTRLRTYFASDRLELEEYLGREIAVWQ
jgi:hypothetical protein